MYLWSKNQTCIKNLFLFNKAQAKHWICDNNYLQKPLIVLQSALLSMFYMVLNMPPVLNTPKSWIYLCSKYPRVLVLNMPLVFKICQGSENARVTQGVEFTWTISKNPWIRLNILENNTISLSCHEQVCLSGLRFERYFSHHWAT